MSTHFHVEYAVAEGLNGVEVLMTYREADAEITGHKLRECRGGRGSRHGVVLLTLRAVRLVQFAIRRVASPSEQLQLEGDEIEAQPSRDNLHQLLMLGVLEFDDLARIDVNQVVVVVVFAGLVAGAAAAE